MKYKAGALVTPVVISLSPLVRAQMTTNSPFSIRAGGAYVLDGTARSALSNFGFLLGLGYDLPFHGLIAPKFGEASVDFDFMNVEGHGNQFDTYSLQYVERVPFSQGPSNQAQPYWGLGVGVAYDHASGHTTVSTGSQIAAMSLPGGGDPPATGGGASTGSGSLNRTQVCGEIILGVRFQQFFVEGAWHIQPSINGVSPNTLSLAVGVHF